MKAGTPASESLLFFLMGLSEEVQITHRFIIPEVHKTLGRHADESGHARKLLLAPFLMGLSEKV